MLSPRRVTIYKPLFCSFIPLTFLSSNSPLTAKAGTSTSSRTLHTHTLSTKSTSLQTTTMFGFSLYQSACLYASVTAFSATWVALALPIQHGKAGPFNYHRAIKRGARIPWRRIPGMKI